ncbi:MAG: hypothetical protein WBX11_09565, partial [Thiobacillaceae bacterium]
FLLILTHGGGCLSLVFRSRQSNCPTKISTASTTHFQVSLYTTFDHSSNAIFLAGDERYACPHSTFMFHGVGFDVQQQMRIEQKNAQEMLDGILADQNRITNIMVERSNLNEAQAADLFKEARTKDAAYAASMGIVSDIRDINIPPGSAIFSLVFQR